MPVPIVYSVPELHRLWASGMSHRDIAAALGCSESCITKLKARHKLPTRPRAEKLVYETDPTPDELEQRARECRERHFAQRRNETDECARIKVWRHAR